MDISKQFLWYITESFHYDDSNQKIVTSVHDEFLKYESSKDISEQFSLNMSISKYAKFVKLEIINDIFFADEISISDYRNKVINIYKGNRKKDKQFLFI